MCKVKHVWTSSKNSPRLNNLLKYSIRYISITHNNIKIIVNVHYEMVYVCKGTICIREFDSAWQNLPSPGI